MSERSICPAGRGQVLRRAARGRGLDLAVPQGETCGLIGPSGAGKSTAIRIIMSILFPDAGKVQVLGHASALEAKDRIGYLPEERGVYRKMRVGAFLDYLAGLKGVPQQQSQSRARELLGQLGLEDVEKKKCEDLSKGMLQRVQFVGSIINQPELLILDEPFSGLDPVSVRLLKDVVAAERRRGTTILFSTHVMAQAEELCDRVVMIHKGRKVLDEPMAKLRRQYDLSRVLFEPLDAAARRCTGVARRAGRRHGVGGREPVRAAPGVRHRPGGGHARGRGPGGAGARGDRAPRLEDVFVGIVQG